MIFVRPDALPEDLNRLRLDGCLGVFGVTRLAGCRTYLPPYFLICADTPFLIRAMARSFELPLKRKSEN